MQNFGIIIYFILFSIITFGKIFLFVVQAKTISRGGPFMSCRHFPETLQLRQDYFMQTIKYPSTQKKSSPLTFSPPFTF